MKKINYLSLTLIISLLFVKCKDDTDNKPNSSNNFNSNSVGALSTQFLSATTYNSLTIEVAYELAAKPSNAAINNLKSFLENRLNKPNGISIKETIIPNQVGNSISLNAIRNIEKSYRTTSNSRNNITAFFYFADKTYSQDNPNSSTLGVAFNSSAMAIFQKTIRENTGGALQASTEDVEEGVVKHEFGHLLGLVNLGSPLQSQHEDKNHVKHCNVESCLMYYATETSLFFGNVLNGSVPSLDTQCIADLRANGGK